MGAFSGNVLQSAATETRCWQVFMEMNRGFVQHQGARFRSFLEALAEPGNVPALVHCTAGKDRTGWAVALLLLALGVDKEEVMQDYLLSNKLWYYEAQKHLVLIRLLSLFRMSRRAIMPLLCVHREYLEAAL